MELEKGTKSISGRAKCSCARHSAQLDQPRHGALRHGFRARSMRNPRVSGRKGARRGRVSLDVGTRLLSSLEDHSQEILGARRLLRGVPKARVSQNVGNLLHREVDFLVAVVEVRRKANARLGGVTRMSRASSSRITSARAGIRWKRCRHVPAGSAGVFTRQAAGLRSCDQARRLADGLLADARHADLADDVEARLAGVERRDLRGAAQKAEESSRRSTGPTSKSNGRLCANQPVRRGASFGRRSGGRRDTQARASAEPLQHAAYGKIRLERGNVHRHRAGLPGTRRGRRARRRGARAQ